MQIGLSYWVISFQNQINMKLYKNGNITLVSLDDKCFQLDIDDWDQFINRENLRSQILEELKGLEPLGSSPISSITKFDPPMGSQEVWAAGVTYLRSKEERQKESEASGGAQFYDKVYDAERPELFFKASAARTVGSGQDINIRRDSTWNVPEPELVLFLSSKSTVEGYTIGNDLSSRSIEGENPLYLPQAKTWNKCAGLGPCLYLPESPLSPETKIRLQIFRNRDLAFEGSTSISQMKRSFNELIEFLFREIDFPAGCFLMTGTGIVPPADFTLQVGDEVRISIEGIGKLVNLIGQND